MGAQGVRRESGTESALSPKIPSWGGRTGLWRADRSEISPRGRFFPNVRATAGWPWQTSRGSEINHIAHQTHQTIRKHT